MSKKQWLALCVCPFVISTGISTVFGLMPVYLTSIGADSTRAGVILAAAYIAMASSTVIGGYLSQRLQRRIPMLIIGGVLAVPLAWWLGTTASVGALLLLATSLWFVTGMVLTMANILAGLFAEPTRRGRIFGMLSVSSGLGLFFGALVSGWIADHWGFGVLFRLLAIVYVTIPCLGLVLHDKPVSERQEGTSAHFRFVLTNRTFRLLFFACILGQAGNAIFALSRPLIMQSLHFTATTMTTAAAIGSLVSLPLSLIIGRLSDQFGRKALIIVCFATTPVGLIILAAAGQLWQFWLASVLQTILGISMVVSSALVTDMFADQALDTALALLNATIWIGLSIGLSASSIALPLFQMLPTIVASVLVSLGAVGLLLLMTVPQRKVLLESSGVHSCDTFENTGERF